MPNDFLNLERIDGVAVVTLDQKNQSVNTLSTSALDEIGSTLGILGADDGVRAIVILSGKADTFVVGADVEELQSFTKPEQAFELSRRAHRMIHNVMALDKPIVAGIHGAAMGGGLELALACSYRIAADDGKTKFGLPEVKLGLLPGGGGTQLLPRLVGIQQALTMMLTGKNVYPRPAKRMGLIDVLTHRPGLRDAAIEAARRLADGTLETERPGPSLAERVMESNPLTRRIIYQKARERVARQTRGNYPAPFHIVSAVQTGMEDGLEAGFEAEARSFSELAFSDVARELIWVFFAQRAAGKNPWPDLPRSVKSIGILGAGLMGGGIAALSAENGLNVAVKDVSLEMAATGRAVAHQYARTKLKKHAISTFERDLLVERVRPVADYSDLAGVDLVIEAVPEDLALKQEVIGETEKNVDAYCIIASNTSSIPIAQIAAKASRPELILGMHYFSPVPKVPLMEIVRTAVNPDDVVATAFDVGRKQGKTVIIVNDGPGFYTTRILSIYMNEALKLLEEGGEIRFIDEAMKDFGFPMGPYQLFDLVGIDVSAKITEVLSGFFKERGLVPSDRASRLVKAGIKGQKTSAGFYLYEENQSSDRPKRKGINQPVYAYFGGTEREKLNKRAVQDRLSLVMVNEAIRCLQEGILDTAADGDVGAVFGLGFPPFLGGPFRFADARGAKNLSDRLSALENKHGAQFSPASLLMEKASTGGRFHD